MSKYVASCDTCQKAVPKGKKVPPVPLSSVPIFGTPFQHVAIDLVGPIKPSSEKGHQYILTMIDVATRFPEAVPMKEITSEKVAEALFFFFSLHQFWFSTRDSIRPRAAIQLRTDGTIS